MHRDLKSPNIMVTRDGHVKVLDFGLAKRVALDGSDGGVTTSESLTAHAMTPGTVIYMSPEQVKGERIDGRTDVFSLGVVLYELATGKLPFEERTSGSTYDAILNRDPLPLRSVNPDVSEELERIVLKALEKDREHRYQTAREVGVDLRRMQRGSIHTGDTAPLFVTRSTRELTIPGTPSRWRVLAAALFAIAVIVLALRLFRPFSGESIHSLAVLPFENIHNNPDVDYLADGIPESLINRLSEVSDLQVMARSTAFRFRGKDVDPRAAGAELGVGAVLTGRVVQRLGRLNVQAELVDVATGSQLWGEQYSRGIADLLGVQNDIAREISEALRLELSGDELALDATQNSKAYQAYLKGRFFLNRRTQADIQKAVTAFELAKEIDPGFALASVGLGDSYIVIGAQWYGVDPDNPPATAMAKARTAAREALELNPNLAEAYVTRAYIEFLQDWDWESSENDFLKAIELALDYVVAHQWYSEFLSAMGRHDESIAQSLRAVELEPTSALQVRGLANSYRQAGRYAEAIVELEKADELDYSHPSTMNYLTQSYWLSGMREQAIVTGYRWNERRGRFFELLAQAKPDEALASLESVAEGELTDQDWINYYILAGDGQKALEKLEQLHAPRYLSLPAILTDAILAPVSEDPRVVELRRSMGL